MDKKKNKSLVLFLTVVLCCVIIMKGTMIILAYRNKILKDLTNIHHGYVRKFYQRFPF